MTSRLIPGHLRCTCALDLGGSRVSLRERDLGIERHDQVDDQTLLGAHEANRPRRRTGRLAHYRSNRIAVVARLNPWRGDCRYLFVQWLEMSHHGVDLGTCIHDRLLDLRGQLVSARQATGLPEA